MQLYCFRIRIVVQSLLFALVAIQQSQADELRLPVLFDMGTEESPAVPSSVRVTSTTLYEPAIGFGWLSPHQAGFDRAAPLPELRHGGNPMRPDLLYHRHATVLNRDGVASEDEMRFWVDVPPGRYRVQVWVGDLHEPLESMAIDCNGVAVATALSAKHIIGRVKPEATGLPAVARFDVDASDGRIDLRFYGDNSQYERDLADYNTWFPDDGRVGTYLEGTWKANEPLKFDPGSPFRRNSVLAIRVARPAERVFAYDDEGRLNLVAEHRDGLEAFVTAVNDGRLDVAEELLAQTGLTGPERLQGYLALLGHLDVEGEDEARVLAATEGILNELRDSAERDVAVLEAEESFEAFSRGRSRFLNRGNAEEGHFQENRKAVSMLRLIPQDDLLYYKALIYQGRALQMLDPHRWVYPSGDAQRIWRKLIEVFPDNRYARYFLNDEWTPDHVWNTKSKAPGDPHAPEWAIAQWEAWNLLLEICEYWADEKQQADGGLGGGWGDDVEFAWMFGLMPFISEGSSDKSLRVVDRLMEGLWKHGGMDAESGFYRGVLDTEHSAEWTGDTLPMMLLLEWDNPIWYERAMKTATLMRQLWMDDNDRGDFHFRSNFLGSVAIGNADQANDSYINMRAVLPAIAAYKHNRNPVVARMFVEWADAWITAAMRTDRGKPRGVFPTEVGFPDGELGGVNSPTWYKSAHPPGTVNYDWEQGAYTAYLVDLMLLAYEITGDDKYLEPFRLQKALVERYRAEQPAELTPGGEMWAARLLSEGTPRGRPSFDKVWPRIERAIEGAASDEPPVLTNHDNVLARMNNVRQRAIRMWPQLTSETSATDRVGFPGIPDPFFVMTGASTAVMTPHATYAGVGRDFAAFVKRADDRRLTVVMYSFSDNEVEAAIVPWSLDMGGSYVVRTGTDSDADDEPDDTIFESSFDLERRGQRIEFALPPHTTTIVDVRQTRPGRGLPQLPDLAIDATEIRYSIWTRDLSVNVHNIGSETASKVRVAFYESDPTESAGSPSERKKIGEAVIPHLSWPLDLCTKSQTVAVPYVPEKPSLQITVVVDEVGEIEELTTSNNTAVRLLEIDLDDVRAPRNRLGEIGGDVTGEIRKGMR